MIKVKIFNNLCKTKLVLLASLYIVDNSLKFLYIRGICSSIFIKGVIMFCFFLSVSIITYKLVCKGTNSRYGHVAGMATTYVTEV
jgi:hypothetical protein